MTFDSLIASDMLKRAKLLLDTSTIIPMNAPYLVILGGQPGSGKSSVIEGIEIRYGEPFPNRRFF